MRRRWPPIEHLERGSSLTNRPIGAFPAPCFWHAICKSDVNAAGRDESPWPELGALVPPAHPGIIILQRFIYTYHIRVSTKSNAPHQPLEASLPRRRMLDLITTIICFCRNAAQCRMREMLIEQERPYLASLEKRSMPTIKVAPGARL